MWLNQCKQISEDYKVHEDKDLLFFQYICNSYIAQERTKKNTFRPKVFIQSTDNSK